MAMRVFPDEVRKMQASKSMRLRHELWHYVRAVWNAPSLSEEVRRILKNLGWGLPDDRGPFSPDRKLLLDNYAGEDFLYMHREMIAMTDRALAGAGEPPISRWASAPEPGDSDFPVPSVWQYADPAQSPEDNAATTQFLTRIKSDAYFERTMRVRETFLTDPANLRRLSLGALGNIAEMTIHNMMHMRWSSDPQGYRPGVNLADPTGGDPHWDDLGYDYLGDTYSSHVNPHFWYLHGWIDDLIDLWADVNNVTDIDWKGTWVGGPDLFSTPDDMKMAAPGMEAMAEAALEEDEAKSAIRRLVAAMEGVSVPSTLIEIAREQEN